MAVVKANKKGKTTMLNDRDLQMNSCRAREHCKIEMGEYMN